jgi:hypothetical protein
MGMGARVRVRVLGMMEHLRAEAQAELNMTLAMMMMKENGQLLLQVVYLLLSRFWKLDLQKQKRTLQLLLGTSVITVKIFVHVLKVQMLYLH